MKSTLNGASGPVLRAYGARYRYTLQDGNCIGIYLTIEREGRSILKKKPFEGRALMFVSDMKALVSILNQKISQIEREETK